MFPHTKSTGQTGRELLCQVPVWRGLNLFCRTVSCLSSVRRHLKVVPHAKTPTFYVGCFFALVLRLLAKRFLQFVPDFMQLGNRFVKYRPLVRFRSKKIVLDRFSDQCLNAGTADFLLRSLNCQSFDIQQIFYTFQQLNVVR